MDATALRALEDVYEQTRQEGTILFLSGVHTQPLNAMNKAGFLDRLGVDNVFENVSDALKHARTIVEAGSTRPRRC